MRYLLFGTTHPYLPMDAGAASFIGTFATLTEAKAAGIEQQLFGGEIATFDGDQLVIVAELEWHEVDVEIMGRAVLLAQRAAMMHDVVDFTGRPEYREGWYYWPTTARFPTERAWVDVVSDGSR